MRLYWAVLACAFLTLSMACGGSAGDSGGSADMSPPPSGSVVDSGAGTDRPAGPDTAVADSKIVITSFVDLEVGSVRGAFDEVSRLARSYGGFVAEARILDANKNDAATLRLRVPASRHTELAGALRGMTETTVKREELRSDEVTAEYADLQSRLVNLESSEAQYRTLLARAGSIDEILKVNQRIDTVRGDIERTKGRLLLYDDQSELATMNVTLAALPVVASSSTPTSSSPVDVLNASLEVSGRMLHLIANAFVLLAVAGLWILPAGVAVLIVRRRYGRRLVALWSRLLSW